MTQFLEPSSARVTSASKPRIPSPSSAPNALTGIDCRRDYDLGIRCVCRPDYNPTIGRQTLSKDRVVLGGARVFSGAAALPRQRSRPSDHRRLGIPPRPGLSGDKHGVYAHVCYMYSGQESNVITV